MASKTVDLRQMIKQKKSEKVEHPLAKYNNLGQLSCVICGIPVKNEIVWSAHLQSKKHKENIQELKQTKADAVKVEKVSIAKPEFKRPSNLSDATALEPSAKKAKSKLPTDFFDARSDQRSQQIPSSSAVGAASKKSHLLSESKTVAEPSSSAVTKLPPDFFDRSSSTEAQSEAESSSGTEQSKKSGSSAEGLPEGFFDDPKKDAKARNVEYKDPKEVEWEKFQRMVQEETQIAESIREEEDQESEMMKDMSEYMNLKSWVSKVESIKELAKGNKRKIESTIPDPPVDDRPTSHIRDNNDSSSSDSDDAIDDLLDWRAKMA